MVSPDGYRLVSDAAKRLRKSGFNLAVYGTTFGVIPARGSAMHLLPRTWDRRFATLEEAIAFCEGWALMEKALFRKAGMDMAELKERVSQQKVMDALKSKKTG